MRVSRGKVGMDMRNGLRSEKYSESSGDCDTLDQANFNMPGV